MTQRLKRCADWLQSHKRIVWAAAVVVFVVNFFGLVSDTLELLGYLGPWALPAFATALIISAHWRDFQSKQAITPIFEMRPIHPPMRFPELFQIHDSIATLAVRNLSGTLLKRCTVRLLGAYPLHMGQLWSSPAMTPSINEQRGESFLLRWASSESAIDVGQLLDIPSDGSERIADVLIHDRRNSSVANFAAAEPEKLGSRLTGIRGAWWKLVIRVASEDGPGESVELLAGVGDREDGPITLAPWEPRGELILANQRKKT